MSLEEKINHDLKEAMKQKEEATLRGVRAIKQGILLAKTEPGAPKELTAEQERAFVIKDNLYRRQLTQEDRLNLYKILVADFDEKILLETRGGDRKSSGSKGNVSPLIQARPSGITAEDLVKGAHAAGVTITHATAKKDIARARALAKGTAKPAATGRMRKSFTFIKKHCDLIVKELEGTDQETRNGAIVELVDLIELLSGNNRRFVTPLNEIRKKIGV